MANEIANIVMSMALSEDSDSGQGLAKDVVDIVSLGISKVGSPVKFFHSDDAVNNPETFDLNDATLKDAFGAGIAFVTLYALWIRNRSGGTLQVGAATNPLGIFGTPATETFQLVNLATFLYLDPTGLTLTPGSSDQLKIAGAAGDMDLIIIGAV